MITISVRSRSLMVNDRLDAHFFTAPGAAAQEHLALLEATGTPIARIDDLARVWDPPRFARAYAAPAEPGIPYLRPYDVFEYLPTSDSRLSLARNDDLEKLVPPVGTLLLTCSGRNLGPLTVADETLSGFALSHDMIRVEAHEAQMRGFLLAYLKTSTGQALLRRGKAGSVIDHITVDDVAAIPIPLVDRHLRSSIATQVETGQALISSARLELFALLTQVNALGPTAEPTRLCQGWMTASSIVANRMDAAFFAPAVTFARRQLEQSGATPLGELAAATLPVRYKRYYVEGTNGRPILSGRQLLQIEPINLRRVSVRSFKDETDYELSEGMTVFGAVGRSEGRQGAASLVTSDRHGWLASNDVMRLAPRDGVSPGRVWLATAATVARQQINAFSFGSVIDHMNPWDVETVRVPDVSEDQAALAEGAWAAIAEGQRLVAGAVADLEAHLTVAGGADSTQFAM